MLVKELKELIIAIKMLIENRAESLAIETEIDKLRLKRWKKKSTKWYFHLNDDDDIPWPDEFEEDWE